MHKRLLALSLLGLLATACSTTPVDESAEWLRPSSNLRRQIEDQVTRLPWTHGIERIEQIQWFASVGEPAYPYLLELCADERNDVAAAAVAALGATGDSRLVEPLRQVRWSSNADAALSFERARAFLRLGDWSQIGVLVDGLEDADPWTRSLCLASLRESTRLDFEFDPAGEPEARARSVARWREWIATRTREGIVAGASAGR